MTDCSCNNFPSSLGTVTFQDDVSMLTRLGIGGPASPDDSLIVAGSLNVNGQFLRNAGSFTLCNGCTAYRWANTTNDTAWMVLTDAGQLGIGTTSPQQALDVAGTVRCTGILLGGDMLIFGAIKDSTGTYTRLDQDGCYYAS